MQGKYDAARTEARYVLHLRPHDPEALQIELAASCELGDRAAARTALPRLAQDVQAMAVRYCARRGIDLTREPAPRPRPKLGPALCPPVELTAVDAAGPPAGGVPLHHPSPADPRRPWRIAFWTGFGATAVSVVALGAIGLSAHSRGQEKEELIFDWRMKTGDRTFGSSSDVCHEAAAVGATELSNLCQRSERGATAANVLVGVGLVAAAVTGYLYYRGYIKKEIVVGPTRVALAF
jgi:hypothetical protein